MVIWLLLFYVYSSMSIVLCLFNICISQLCFFSSIPHINIFPFLPLSLCLFFITHIIVSSFSLTLYSLLFLFNVSSIRSLTLQTLLLNYSHQYRSITQFQSLMFLFFIFLFNVSLSKLYLILILISYDYFNYLYFEF